MNGLRKGFFLLAGVTACHAWAAPADFAVSSGAKTFKLSDAGGKFVALHFLLKTECPFCLKHVQDYTRQAPTVAGVVHVFLKPDSEEDIKAWSQKMAGNGAAAEIYRDPDAKLAKEFDVPDGYRFHDQIVHYPALVLLDPTGKEVFRYIGKDNTDRYSFAQFAMKITELSKTPALKDYNLSAGKPAIEGYDPVSYFEAAKPEKGSKEYASTYRGVTYQFASDQRRGKFASDPAKYVPAYGGWCATAMADGRKVEIDPNHFKVTNGRLFLFYKGWLGDALKDWNKDESRLMNRADEQWRKVAPKDTQ